MPDFSLYKSNKVRHQIQSRTKALADMLAVGARRQEGRGDESTTWHDVAKVFDGELKIRVETDGAMPLPECFVIKSQYQGGDPSLPGLYSFQEIELAFASLMQFVFRHLSRPDQSLAQMSFSVSGGSSSKANTRKFKVTAYCHREFVFVSTSMTVGNKVKESEKEVRLERHP
jgi:hypothetical protein